MLGHPWNLRIHPLLLAFIWGLSWKLHGFVQYCGLTVVIANQARFSCTTSARALEKNEVPYIGDRSKYTAIISYIQLYIIFILYYIKFCIILLYDVSWSISYVYGYNCSKKWSGFLSASFNMFQGYLGIEKNPRHHLSVRPSALRNSGASREGAGEVAHRSWKGKMVVTTCNNMWQ